MGCSLCRSEKLAFLVKETDSSGFNLEKRDDLMKKHGHINVPVHERMNLVRGGAGGG